MIHLLLHLAALSLIALAIVLPGLVAARRVGGLPRPLVTLAAWCLGLGGWTVALFTLAALAALDLQLYRPTVLVGLLVAATVGGAVALGAPGALGLGRRLGRRLGAGPTPEDAPGRAPIRSSARVSPLAVPLAVPLALAVVAMFVPPTLHAFSPSVAWDAATYHLALPDLYLAHGGFVDVPFSVYSHWPLGVQLLYGLALALGETAGGALGGQIVASLMHLGCGLLLVAGLHALARVADPEGTTGRAAATAWCAAAMVLLNDVVLFELGTAYVDVAMAFVFFATFTFAGAAADSSDGAADFTGDSATARRDACLLLAGVSAALLAGTKLTGVVAAACALLPLGPWGLRAVRRPDALRALGRGALSVALPIGLVLLAWGAKAWLATGNPVYPFLHSVFGGPEWSADLARRLADWQGSIGRGREPLDHLLLPWRVIVEGGRGYSHFDGATSLVWLVALPIALLGWRDRWVDRALATSGAWFVFWALSSQQMRFLIPILPLLAFAAARSLVLRLERRGAARTARTALLAVALLAVALLAVYGVDHRERITRSARLAALYASRPTPTEVPRPEVFRRAEALPDDARLLLLGVNHLYYSPRPALADSFFEASQISDWLSDAPGPGDVARRLAERGVTHVVWTAGSESIYPTALRALLTDPAAARVLWRGDRHVLLALQPPAAAP